MLNHRKLINNILTHTICKHLFIYHVHNNAVVRNDTICNKPYSMSTDAISDYFLPFENTTVYFSNESL